MKLIGQLKNKHHLLLHYVRVMKMFGSPSAYWTMRHLSKHRDITEITDHLAGSKNFIMSIAIDLQLQINNSRGEA